MCYDRVGIWSLKGQICRLTYTDSPLTIKMNYQQALGQVPFQSPRPRKIQKMGKRKLASGLSLISHGPPTPPHPTLSNSLRMSFFQHFANTLLQFVGSFQQLVCIKIKFKSKHLTRTFKVPAFVYRKPRQNI